MRLLPLTLLALALSGCATSLFPITPTQRAPSRSYEIGATTTVNTGEPMFRVRRAYSLPAFTPAASFTAPKAGLVGSYATLTPGQVWTAVATDADGNYVLQAPADAGVGAGLFLSITPEGQIARGWILNDGAKPLQDGFPPGASLEPIDGPPLEGSYMAEMVYSGRSGDTIRTLFREYVSDLARPAYSQELTYDLSEDSEIRYRSIVIDVDEAGGSGITYRIVSDGDLDWLPE